MSVGHSVQGLKLEHRQFEHAANSTSIPSALPCLVAKDAVTGCSSRCHAQGTATIHAGILLHEGLRTVFLCSSWLGYGHLQSFGAGGHIIQYLPASTCSIRADTCRAKAKTPALRASLHAPPDQCTPWTCHGHHILLNRSLFIAECMSILQDEPQEPEITVPRAPSLLGRDDSYQRKQCQNNKLRRKVAIWS